MEIILKTLENIVVVLCIVAVAGELLCLVKGWL